MKGRAQIRSFAHRAVDSRDVAGFKRGWIRGSSKEHSLSVSTIPPELLQLPTSLADRTLNRQMQKLRWASLNF